MKKTAVFTLAALTTMSMPVRAAAPNMAEGLWEMVVKSEISNVPPANAPTQTVQRCMTAKDFTDPRKAISDPKAGGQCDVSNYRLQGTTATWDVSCKGPDAMKGTGTMTLEGQRYNGTQKMSGKQDGQTVQVTMNYAGRYLGPCKNRPK